MNLTVQSYIRPNESIRCNSKGRYMLDTTWWW